MREDYTKHKVRKLLVWVSMGLSVILLLCSLTLTRTPGDTDYAARKLERILGKKMDVLNSYVQLALSEDHNQWLDLEGLPNDMVIYRYLADTLQSWSNQFPVLNDDISSKVFVQVLASPRSELISPLSEIDTKTSYLNLGPKYYLAKTVTEDDCTIVAGLEIQNILEIDENNGVNSELRLSGRFSIAPLSTSGGTAVNVEGNPQFKILNDTLLSFTVTNSYFIWVALVFFIFGLMLILMEKRSIFCFWIVLSLVLSSMAALFVWGIRIQSEVKLFSPTLYADGPFLYSLGALLILNLSLTLLVLCVFIVRREILRRMYRRNFRLWMIVSAVAIFVVITAILFYTQFAFRSIISNSNITLELYKLPELSLYTGVVYGSFIVLLMTLPMLVQMQMPAFKTLFSRSFNTLSNSSRVVFSTLIAIYLVALASIFGFRKEKARLQVWANMLSIERDITLELELRSIENSIADDLFIGSLSVLSNGGSTILNRVVDNYLFSVSQSNDISVFVLNSDNSTPQSISFYNERISSGRPIFDGSRFIYTISPNGHVRYTGVFVYYNQAYGVTHLLLEVEPKSNDLKGNMVPPLYSYAKYNGETMSFFRGHYPYPTRLEGKLYSQIYQEHSSSFVYDGNIHFINETSDNEAVIISRRVIGAFQYLLASVFIALLSYLLLSLIGIRQTKRYASEKGYYKSRVASILTISLLATLVTMATVSVIFVYKRYDANKEAIMSGRVTSVQALVEDFCRQVVNIHELNNQEGSTMIRSVSGLTSAEVTLYDVGGKVLLTSDTGSFEDLSVSSRVDEDAYESIIYRNRRYYIKRAEKGIGGNYELFAPIFNERGSLIAIMSTSYSDESFDFEMEAVLHLVTVLTVFLILLILARFMILTIVDRMFKPLSEMGRKMKAANVEELEYIEYDRDDEIASLVNVYNRMVTDLSESSKKLAQAERDKAWSAMARQVAHEIKNPLTPMKLQLQRIIRLKARDDAQWQSKFDEATKVILDHIDILTDTANEFSTFAKLYTEEAIEFDLDAVLKEEIAMFDNRDNIEFSYAGLDGARITGPKPQLTRVFVNLINNAVQALEDKAGGRIFIALRNSVKDGYYDIVFEDNGPGVPPENQKKLFTPNFTTKSSGTGLGLAISRSILERCSADISYSKSFSLGGACFTITMPK